MPPLRSFSLAPLLEAHFYSPLAPVSCRVPPAAATAAIIVASATAWPRCMMSWPWPWMTSSFLSRRIMCDNSRTPPPAAHDDWPREMHDKVNNKSKSDHDLWPRRSVGASSLLPPSLAASCCSFRQPTFVSSCTNQTHTDSYSLVQSKPASFLK